MTSNNEHIKYGLVGACKKNLDATTATFLEGMVVMQSTMSLKIYVRDILLLKPNLMAENIRRIDIA